MSVDDAQAIACQIVRGELHPLDGCNAIVALAGENNDHPMLRAFAQLVDIYEFHLAQPATIKRIIELSEEFCSWE
jgi:hypothetical protein